MVKFAIIVSLRTGYLNFLLIFVEGMMKHYTVIFSLFRGDEYKTAIYAANRSDAIKKARKEKKSSFFYSSAKIISIRARVQ